MKDHGNILRGWRLWEAAALIALCAALLTGVAAQSAQRSLTDSLLRLHVIAASDSGEDQARKLAVRDAVLECLRPALENTADRDGVEARTAALLPELRNIAARVGGTEASVSLETRFFPTRDYGSFSLPAGHYRALCITLGEGAGQNWWCVVFPPLCTEAVSAPADTPAGLSDAQWEVLQRDAEGGYSLRFRVLELWGELFG